MKIGCTKEIKNNEFRVGITPDNARAYIAAGHEVYIEKGAGNGSGFSDEEYAAAGAVIIDDPAKVWEVSEMMVKVKEPLESEYPLFHEGLILYTYLHLAADKEQTDALLAGKVQGVAYETLQEKDNSLPLLVPMSQIAGRLSIQEGAKYLEKKFGGRTSSSSAAALSARMPAASLSAWARTSRSSTSASSGSSSWTTCSAPASRHWSPTTPTSRERCATRTWSSAQR